MINKCIISVLLLFTCYLLTDCSTAKNKTDNAENLRITLRWVKSYPQETQEKVEIGLKWILSYLGAMLPQENIDKTIVWKDDHMILLDISKAGFSATSNKAWNLLLGEIKQTEEYSLLGSLDLGRFVMMSFNSSENYYAITGVEKVFTDFKESYKFDPNDQESLLPGQSAIAPGLRKMYFSTGQTVDQLAHIAEEGIGDDPKTFKVKEMEVFDFMLNGQPRFAVYGVDGHLKIGGNPDLSGAGKPSKCMWCHESGVQLPFKLMNDFPDQPKLLFDFKEMVKLQNTILDTFYYNLIVEVDTFRLDKANHYLAELLYINYQKPTKQRAQNELLNAGISDKDFDFQIIDTTHHEFKFLKNLISRNELDDYLPYQSDLKIDARETYVNR